MIRFRVWLSAEKLMVYPDDERGGSVFNASFAIQQNGEPFAYCQDKDSGERYWYRNLNAAICMLSAGVTSGIERWVGDVVKVPYNNVYDFAYYLIVWDEEKGALYTECLGLHHKETGFKDISRGGYCVFYAADLGGEVLGNIYENPELLEVEGA